MKWTAPDFDGGAPIEKYIIEKKDRYKPDWEKAMEVPGNQLEAKVGDLKERGEYQFRIIAVNKAGPSPPSDASKMQICKHKARKYRISFHLFICRNTYTYSSKVSIESFFHFFFYSYSETKNRSYELETNHGSCWQANQIRRGRSW